MSQTRTLSAPTPRDVAATRPGWLTRVAGNTLSKIGRKGLLAQLNKLQFGELTVEENGQTH